MPGGDVEGLARALCCEGMTRATLADETATCGLLELAAAFAVKEVAAIQALLPDTTRHLQQAVDIPLSSVLSVRDCDHLVAAVRRVASAMGRSRARPQAIQVRQPDVRSATSEREPRLVTEPAVLGAEPALVTEPDLLTEPEASGRPRPVAAS